MSANAADLNALLLRVIPLGVKLRDKAPKESEPGQKPRYAYVVHDAGAPIEAGAIGYPDFETAVIEAAKMKAAEYAVGQLSEADYRGALNQYLGLLEERRQALPGET
jgi:hypothetical protein